MHFTNYLNNSLIMVVTRPTKGHMKMRNGVMKTIWGQEAFPPGAKTAGRVSGRGSGRAGAAGRRGLLRASRGGGRRPEHPTQRHSREDAGHAHGLSLAPSRPQPAVPGLPTASLPLPSLLL